MLRKVLVIVALAAIIVFSVSGCKKERPVESKPPESEQAAPKTMAEYEADAKKEINKKNMAAELEKLEKEIEEDIRLGR